jgi:hypothetical protein
VKVRLDIDVFFAKSDKRMVDVYYTPVTRFVSDYRDREFGWRLEISRLDGVVKAHLTFV